MVDEAQTSSTRIPRPLLSMLGHTTVVLFLLTLGYYMLPAQRPWDEPMGLVRVTVSAVALAGLAVVLGMQARRSRRTIPRQLLRIQWLLTALYVLVLTFALTYLIVATLGPAQFVGIADRTDALYFSVTVIGTVGFGDIYPAGTLAQLLVTVQMLFNLVYLGTALRILSAGTRTGPPGPDLT